MTTLNNNSKATEVTLGRHIGLGGGIALVIGGVIGMGIYALIAAVGAQAGTGLWLAFVLAIVISGVGVAPLIQIASALPRELFAQARDGIMPPFLKRIHPRTRTPLNAVTVYFSLMLALILTGRSVDFFGVITAVGILMMTATIAVAAVRLPDKFPREYSRAFFRIPKTWLVVLAVISVLSSLGFVFIVIMEMPVAGLIYAALSLVVAAYYFIRVRWLKRIGVDWEAQMKVIPGEED